MRWFGVLFVVVLTGCASFDQAVESGVHRASRIVDDLNEKSLWQLCEGSTLAGYQRHPPDIRVQVAALCIARGGPWVPPGQ